MFIDENVIKQDQTEKKIKLPVSIQYKLQMFMNSAAVHFSVSMTATGLSDLTSADMQ